MLIEHKVYTTEARKVFTELEEARAEELRQIEKGHEPVKVFRRSEGWACEYHIGLKPGEKAATKTSHLVDGPILSVPGGRR